MWSHMKAWFSTEAGGVYVQGDHPEMNGGALVASDGNGLASPNNTFRCRCMFDQKNFSQKSFLTKVRYTGQ